MSLFDPVMVSQVMVLVLEVLAVALGIVAIIAMLRHTGPRNEEKLDEIKKKYESKIQEYEKKIQELREKHKRELEEIGRINTMLIELKKAIDAGAVRIVCPIHPDAEVRILADGSILCSKDHLLWPQRGEEQ